MTPGLNDPELLFFILCLMSGRILPRLFRRMPADLPIPLSRRCPVQKIHSLQHGVLPELMLDLIDGDLHVVFLFQVLMAEVAEDSGAVICRHEYDAVAAQTFTVKGDVIRCTTLQSSAGCDVPA